MADWHIIAKCVEFAEYGAKVATGEAPSDHLHCSERLLLIAQSLRGLLPPGFPPVDQPVDLSSSMLMALIPRQDR